MKLVTLISILAIVCLSSNAVISQERHLVPFEIKDQFDKVYTEKHYAKKVVLLIGSDKAGKEFNPIWSNAIEETLEENGVRNKVSILGIANLKGVPFFLKGLIKGKLPKDPENRLLLDWSGHFSKSYKFEKKVCNILLFDKEGNLALKTYGTEMESHKFNFIIDKITELTHKDNIGQ